MDDDIFDTALNLEQQHAQEGFDEGLRRAHGLMPGERLSCAATATDLPAAACYSHSTPSHALFPSPRRDGRESGRAEGRVLGLQTGFEVRT